MNHRQQPVTVEYDKCGTRVQKSFADLFASRRFFYNMHKRGRKPSLLGVK